MKQYDANSTNLPITIIKQINQR